MSSADDLLRRSDEEVRQLLRRRKKRTQTSCLPCRSRKVKCDRCSPCDNCAKRGYPELCSFATQGATGSGTSPGPSKSTIPGNQPAQPSTQSPSAQQSPHGPYQTPGPGHSVALDAHNTNSPLIPMQLQPDVVSEGASQPRTGTTGYESPGANQGRSGFETLINEDRGEPFLGTNSMRAFIRDQTSQTNSPQNVQSQNVEAAILPILGLQESRSTYPFLPVTQMCLKKMDLEVRQVLPLDLEIIRLFRCYQQEVHTFSPILPDIESFEFDLCAYLDQRASEKRRSHDQNHDTCEPPAAQRCISWVGLLFAVLASGVQYSNISFRERQTKSQLYIRYSFQCLRMANFLARPSLLCIQTLLILGNVLQNDMKPEVAWNLLGTTSRMAQSLGLHEENNLSSPRRKTWLALVWQDSLLSLCFDRSPVTTPARVATELHEGTLYTDAMNSLCDETLRSMNARAYRDMPNFTTIFENVARIEDIRLKSTGNLGGTGRVSSIRQRCEGCALNLHISFVIAWLCRPALRNGHGAESRNEVQLQLIEKCIKNLLECVRAFVQLHSLSTLASRSWAVIHNGLSSALLLGLLGKTTTDPEARESLGSILEILSTEPAGEGGQRYFEDGNIELSRPHLRAVAVLRRLYNDHANGSTQNYVADNARQSSQASQSQFQPTVNVEMAPSLISSGANANALNYLDAVAPQPYDNLGQADPLTTFDSIIWDSIEFGGSALNYNPSISEAWMF
ncbi:hypothetical protein B0J14DRAFT_602713 [Halenospora varia]|nr:hypothetical protein B0J14DRAFT_602713 [Halenospora varia]